MSVFASNSGCPLVDSGKILPEAFGVSSLNYLLILI